MIMMFVFNDDKTVDNDTFRFPTETSVIASLVKYLEKKGKEYINCTRYNLTIVLLYTEC